MAGTTMAVVGGLAGAYSSMKQAKAAGQGGGGSPAWQQAYQQKLNRQADRVNKQIAGFTPDQLDAMQMGRDLVGQYGGDYNDLVSNARGLTGGVTPEQVAQWMNPYQSQVVDSYLADLSQMRGQARAESDQAAQMAKAFGGDREAVYNASLQGDLDRTGARTLADLNYRGYENAQRMANQNFQNKFQGNAALADMVNRRLGYNLQDINLLHGIGGQVQARNQAVLDAPMDTIRFRSEINNGGAYQAGTPGQYVDPFGAAISGFQGGANQLQQFGDWWKKTF